MKHTGTGPEEADAKIQDGDILVAPDTTKDFVPAMRRAAGVIVQTGGLTSHAAIVCLQLGIPLLLEFDGWERLPDGRQITLDPARGIVYDGVARV